MRGPPGSEHMACPVSFLVSFPRSLLAGAILTSNWTFNGFILFAQHIFSFHFDPVPVVVAGDGLSAAPPGTTI